MSAKAPAAHPISVDGLLTSRERIEKLERELAPLRGAQRIDHELAKQMWIEAGRQLGLEARLADARAEMDLFARQEARLQAVKNDLVRFMNEHPARAHAWQEVLDAVRLPEAKAAEAHDLVEELRHEGARSRGRGRRSRTALTVRLMLEASPDLSRAPAAWVELEERLPFLDPTPVGGTGNTDRRRLWAQLLRRAGKVRPRRNARRVQNGAAR